MIGIILIYSCDNIKQRESSEATHNKISEAFFLDSNWKELKTQDSIPLILQNKINHYFQSMPIAGFNEAANATDMILDSIPRIQIRYIATLDSCWKLSYFVGGIAKHYVYINSKVSNDSVLTFQVQKVREVLDNRVNIELFEKGH